MILYHKSGKTQLGKQHSEISLTGSDAFIRKFVLYAALPYDAVYLKKSCISVLY